MLENHRRLFALVALMFALTGCQKEQAPPAPDTRAADEGAIRVACNDQIKAFTAGDTSKFVGFYADDVVFLAPDALIQGKQALQKYVESMLTEKPEGSFNVAKIEVAKSGDVGYEWGSGKMVVKGRKGSTETIIKSLTVWKKQGDGTWKIIADTFIPGSASSAPVKTAPTKKTQTHRGRKK